MNIEIVDQIPSRIEGAPPKYIGLREDGAFGLVEAPPLAMLKPPPPQLKAPMMLSDSLDVARAVVGGDARAITKPYALRDLAVTVLALAAHVGRLSMTTQALSERLAEIDGEAEQPSEGALS